MRKRKCYRKVTAFILAFAMAVCTPGSSLFNKSNVVKAADGDGTAISNSGFEEYVGDDQWSHDWECTKTNTGDSITWKPYSGNEGSGADLPSGDTDNSYAVNVWSGSNDAVFTFSQDIELEAGRYKFSFKGMGDNTSYKISLYNNETLLVDGEVVYSSGWNNWNDVSVRYTSPSNQSVTLKLTVTTTAGDGWGYIDCVSFKYSTEPEIFQLYYYDTSNEDHYIQLWNTECLNYVENETETVTDPYSWNTTFIKLAKDTNNDNWYYTTLELSDPDASSGFDVYKESSNTSIFQCASETHNTDIFSEIMKAENGSKLYIIDGKIFTGIDDANYYIDSQRTFVIDTTPSTEGAVTSDLYIDKVGISDSFITGFDISSYRSIRNSGASFKDEEGNVLSDEQFFAYLKSSGVNWVRIRVWVDPKDENGKTYGGGGNDLAVAKDLGKLASDAGIRVLIDFHYSDFWTNPGKQNAPKEWKNLSLTDKADRLQQYTIQSLNELIEAHVDVGMVQIGNETNDGFCGETTMVNMCKLFEAGSEGIRAVEEEKNISIMIAIHVADPTTLDFDSYAASLENNHVVYDVFATSYYPYWHGTLDNLEAKLSSVAKKYNKYVMVAETSYVNTLDDGDGHENTESKKKLDTDTFPYPVGVQGQALHVRNVVNTVAGIKDNDNNQKGIGVFYWEPAWIPVNHYDASLDNAEAVLAENKSIWEEYGSGWATSAAAEYDDDVDIWYGGSAVDNEGVFDFDGKALETVKIYKMIRGGTTNTEDYVLEVKTSAEFEVDEEIVLPDTVNLFFASGKEITVNVTWNEDELEAAKANGIGEYIISGTTEEYDGQTYDAKCTLKLKPINYLINPSFEDPLTGNWVLDDSGIARKNSSQDSNNNIRTGSYNLHFYLENGGEHTFYQTLTLDKGIYRAGGYLSGEAKSDDAQIALFFKIGDNEYTDEGIMTGWNNWSNPEVSDIEIANDNTEVTIGIRAADFGAKAWGAYEDFYIYKTGDIEEKSIPEEPKIEEPTPEEPKIEEPTPEAPTTPTVKYLAMYRLYNPNSGEHFYTSNEAEKNNLVKLGWNYEGVAWSAPESSDVPVYRLYNPNAGDHHYTVSATERDFLVKVGWNYEGIGWYSESEDGNPLYRLYNPNATTGTHHYTVNKEERDFLIKLGWSDEGIGWYGK